MKKQMLKGLLLTGAAAMIFASCKKKHDDHEHNHEEVITTMRLTFTPVTGGNAVSFEYDDADGPGGAAPTIQTISLAPNTSYHVALRAFNKTKNPVEELTGEISAEGGSHRFYFVPSGNGITVTNLNNDAAGVPLGLSSTWTTVGAGNGTMRVVLRHYGGNPPNKAANDPIDSPKSSTDADVTFNTAVQ